MKITRHTLIPLGADLLAMALAWGLVGWLRDSFVVRNTGAGLVLAAALILHFGAVSQLKKLALQPDGHAWPGLLPWLGEERRRVVAFFFSLFMAWAMVEQSGFFRSLTQVELGDTGLSYHLMLGPLLWIVLAFLYMLVFSAPTDTTLDPADNRSAFTLFMALLVVNLMVSVVAGYFAAATYLDSLSPTIRLFLIIPLFTLFFLPPRLLHLFRSRLPATILLPFALLIVLNAWLASFH